MAAAGGVAALALVIACGAQPGGETDVSDVSSTRSFVGWRGETPVFRDEHLGEDSSQRTDFVGLEASGEIVITRGQRTRDADPPAAPPGLEAGTVLVDGFEPTDSGPRVTLVVQADAEQQRAMDDALRRWSENPAVIPDFPVVPTRLELVLTPTGGSARTIWEEQRRVSVRSDPEYGYQYEETRLRFAVLSPSGRTLCIELLPESEFLRIPLPP